MEVLLENKTGVTVEQDQKDANRIIITVPEKTISSPSRPAEEPAKKTVAGKGAGQSSSSSEADAADKDIQQSEKVAKAEAEIPDQGLKKTGTDLPVAEGVVLASAKSSVKSGENGLTGVIKYDKSIQLKIAGPVESYRAFRLNQPERLVIDIVKIRNLLSVNTLEINGFNLGKARIGGSPDKLRVVFDSTGVILPYKVVKNETGLLLDFGETPAAEQPKATSAAVSDTKKTASDMSLPGTIDALEFSQADGVSRITVKTSGRCSSGQPVKTIKGYSLSLKDCRLPGKLQRQLDTRGFDSAIKSIAPISIKGRTPETRIAVNLRGTLSNSLKHDGDTYRWEFSEPNAGVKQSKGPKIVSGPRTAGPAVQARQLEPVQDVQKTKMEKPMEDAFGMEKDTSAAGKYGKIYTGRKVTLEFSDADIRKIFQLLAEVSNQNFLISDDVTGTISLKLVNVPWDQALDVILENKGLGMKKEGNIVQIRPRTKMKSLDDESVELRISEEKKMPLSTVIFDVNFSSLSEIEKQFKQLKSLRSDASVSGDARTNKVIVVDIEPNIKKMRALLQSIDVPEKQVMIEARIVEAESTFARDIGVKWNFGYQDGSASNANINNLTSSMGGVVSSTLPTTTTGGIAAGMAFGKLLSNVQLDMRLSAAATVGQLKIISTPKVMTVNNKPAKISQGQMIPYQNTSSTEGAKTEFIEAALSLEVTPHITADGSVSMKIKASNNTAGTGSPPPINKKEATTELVVKNGETTVIGGIYVDRETEGETGIPYISEIPLLGWLFKSNSKNKTKNELLIFITPKIIS
jgi:type IV pilus assembly protein PilQ